MTNAHSNELAEGRMLRLVFRDIVCVCAPFQTKKNAASDRTSYLCTLAIAYCGRKAIYFIAATELSHHSIFPQTGCRRVHSPLLYTFMTWHGIAGSPCLLPPWQQLFVPIADPCLLVTWPFGTVSYSSPIFQRINVPNGQCPTWC